MSKSTSTTVSSSATAVVFLVELRARLMRVVICFLGFFAVLLYFSDQLYVFLAFPLLKFLPQGHLIATQLTAPFMVPFKLAMMVAALLAVPYFLYQAWAFITPALYAHERKIIWPLLLCSTILFYLGMAFAYIIIFPMLFHFLSHIAPQGVLLSPEIGEYLDFTMKLLLTFGGLFEIPVIMTLLVWSRFVSLDHFVRWRGYAVIGAFVLGMLLAPPDVLSQVVLSIPIWLLYEVGILLGRLGSARKVSQQSESHFE